MDHGNSWKEGVYESVLPDSLHKKLQQALDAKQIFATIDEVDPQEAVRYLSEYVRHLVQCCLKDIADGDTQATLQQELALTNDLVRLLGEKLDVMDAGQQVTQPDFLLKDLAYTRNRLERPKWIRPVTSLSKSFLFTNSRKDISLVSELTKEIASSDRVDFLVSFIKFSGLRMILPQLREFTSRGGRLRVLTTTYTGATDPKAIRVLAALPNTEVRVSYNVRETRLHAKSYIFHRESGFSTAYIGSSNLSHAAIADGLEWNMKVTRQDLPGILDKMETTFAAYWESREFEPYTAADADKLEQAIAYERCGGERGTGSAPAAYTFAIRPFSYQQVILDALQVERQERNRWRNLIVAATGTGKTAISAFDYRNFKESRQGPTTLLFIAHRKEILEQARSCFRQVLQDPNFGELFVGGEHAAHAEHVFMSIQSFQSQALWERLDPTYYDMIIVDEFHHAAAASYQKLLTYFQPKILLGMTATPERMDGKDVLQYFGSHIAAEIRLPDAIERRLLCPFHYFGVADTVDLSGLRWTNGQYNIEDLNNAFALDAILANRRAHAILDAVDRYTADWRDIRGIGFCVSKVHAHFMAQYCNEHNVPALALDDSTPDRDRAAAKEKLESGQVTFLFAVDLFNEGVDIPSVNTVLFLRPTNSLTVFLQQLGRGLRLAPHKDCLTVLDFVAQANRNYNFAGRMRALVGSQDVAIRHEITDGFPHLPKGCSIQLEEIAQQRILENITARLRRAEYYKELVRELYAAAGNTVPSLQEFLRAADVDAETFYNGNRTYARLCADAGIVAPFTATPLETILQKAFPRLLSVDSPKWITWLQQHIPTPPAGPVSTWPAVEQQYLRMWQYTIWQKDAADAGFADAREALTLWADQGLLAEELRQLLDYQFDRFTILPKDAALPYPCALEVYCTYSRDQIFAALGVDNPSSVREGVRKLDEKKTDIFLVTLNKTEQEFSDTTLYEDYSINERLFHWQSQSRTTPESPTGQRYIHQNELGWHVLLFVRERKKESHGATMNYTFLGQAHITQWSGSQPMSIIYKLDHPIPAKYITTTDSSGVL
ncbi:MAG: DUF3427 domain-containing protein [Succiniclasticum sp.]|jgi:superfamily II DNA or RNA helicase